MGGSDRKRTERPYNCAKVCFFLKSDPLFPNNHQPIMKHYFAADGVLQSLWFYCEVASVGLLL